MKILIYGAGIVGSVYGWQLSEAGHDLTVLVRKGQKEAVEKNGITIHCTDFRGGKKQAVQTVFRPKVIDELVPQNDYEYILVTVNYLQLKHVLPVLSQSAGKAQILFFQNNWDSFDEIAACLSPDQYFFGFPFMAGGGRDGKGINCAISGLEYSQTFLGETTGEITPRVQKIAKALEDARLKPTVSTRIKTWLITHYAVAGGLSAGIIKAGSGKAFAHNPKLIKEAIRAIREGFEICLKRGVNPKTEKANELYYLPLFIGASIAKKIYGSETLCIMFDGHTKHSPHEIKRMLEDIIVFGEKYNVKMPYLRSLQASILEIIENENKQ